MGSPDALRRDNVATALAVAEAVLEAAPGAALTVLGSAAEYGPPLTSEPIAETHPCRPVTAYGRAKWEASRQILRLAERRGLRANIVRPFNVIGVPLSDAQVLGAFVAKAAEIYDADAPRRVEMGRLDAIRDFVAVDDLVLLVRSLVRDDRSGILVNVCAGMRRRVRDLVAFLNALSDDRFTVVEEDAAPLSASAGASVPESGSVPRRASRLARVPSAARCAAVMKPPPPGTIATASAKRSSPRRGNASNPRKTMSQ